MGDSSHSAIKEIAQSKERNQECAGKKMSRGVKDQSTHYRPKGSDEGDRVRG